MITRNDQMVVLHNIERLASAVEGLVEMTDISDESKAHFIAELSELREQCNRRWYALLGERRHG